MAFAGLRIVAAAAAVGALCAGCGSGGSPRGEPPARAGGRGATAVPLGDPPVVVRRFCTRAKKAVPVLCPAAYPRVRGSRVIDGRNLTLPDYEGYLVTFNDTAFRTEDAGHVFLGAQPGPLPLAGRPGERWPRSGAAKPDKEMRILGGRAQVLRRAVVRGASALVIRVPQGYPGGGVHSRHVIVLWNSGGHGYLVSVHLQGGRGRFRYTETDRVNAALAIARSARVDGED